MDLKRIKSEQDYQSALKKLDQLFEAKIGTQESDEAEVLALLVDEYGKKEFSNRREKELSNERRLNQF
ncbi:hypothetical protein [Algoriphagus antarcticus]|uniref:HTH-type transcriptional regulator/antitoxin HigA n=1 Tax=Algoriphagus antarcticus TaxID=238540 RepID=A0A3E0DTU6_9BACT|nr:hypothetical protein [Algoriphagus antarcticus]REG86328.1 hypothetical protein C8N25_11232 [Algoriphagus antarcticus]